MIVDYLLQLFGEDPRLVPDGEKWVFILVHLFNTPPIIVSIILAILPFAWLFWQKRKNNKVSKKQGVTSVVVAVMLFILGFYLLDFIAEIIGGIGLRQLYSDWF